MSFIIVFILPNVFKLGNRINFLYIFTIVSGVLLRFEIRELIDIFSSHYTIAHWNVYFLINFNGGHYHLHSLSDPFIFKHIPELSCQVEIRVGINQFKLIKSFLFIDQVIGPIDSLFENFGDCHITLWLPGEHRITYCYIIIERLIGFHNFMVVRELMERIVIQKSLPGFRSYILIENVILWSSHSIVQNKVCNISFSTLRIYSFDNSARYFIVLLIFEIIKTGIQKRNKLIENFVEAN